MKRLRILLVWTSVSLLLQFGAYSLLNYQVEKVLEPPGVSSEPISSQLKTTIPSSDLENVQVSYANEYLAYLDNGTLRIFNFDKKKVVFESPSANDPTLGVLAYQWLPDRNTLLYFYADKGSNFGSSQTTELYTLELSGSNEDTEPDNRVNKTVKIPAGGKIEELVVSPSTNLMYFTVKKGSTEQLMEIDVMKDVRTLNQSGESIDNMVASDQHGTLYIDSKVGSTRTVIAFSSGKRKLISRNNYDKILGIRGGKVYLGEVKNNELVKIKSITDRSNMTDNPSLKTEWTGSIPFENAHVLVGSKSQVIVYDNQMAYVVTAGLLKEIHFSGDQNYISDDGARLIRLSQQGTSTLVELQPLSK